MSVRELRELRIGYLGGEELAAALASVCETNVLEAGEWRARLEGATADLLLVEGREHLDPEWREEIESMLSICAQLSIPRLLWVTGERLDRAYLELADHFDRAFATSVPLLATVFEAGFRDPSLLWTATALPVDDRAAVDTAVRPDPILWVGGWRDDWAESWRSRLREVLRAASARGLRIIGVDDPATLPEQLRKHVRTTALGRAEALEQARVVIAADPAIGTGEIVPGILFDAIACGAAVLSPAPVGKAWDFCRGGTLGAPPEDLIPPVEGFEDACAEFDRLLQDNALREETVHLCRRVVTYNHTYAHRAATLASAAGQRLIP